MRESKIESAVCEYAEAHGYLAYKFSSPARKNVPDRIMVPPYGVIFMIEFKATGETPTEAQEREFARLEKRGVPVFVIDDIEEGKKLVRRMV
jgi:hypothetical protein